MLDAYTARNSRKVVFKKKHHLEETSVRYFKKNRSENVFERKKAG
jgi:hypothetical protein